MTGDTNDNSRAALFMTLAMALFAIEDAFIKGLSHAIPVWQILAMTGALCMVAFWVQMARKGVPFVTRALIHPRVMTRNAGEVIGTFGFVTALATGELSSTSAILQVLPLALVLGGAVFLGEKVGWRRWLSVAIGFAGVMLILRPGTAAFHPSMLWAVLGVIGLMIRDLTTRLIPRDIPSDQLSASAFGAIAIAGVVLAVLPGDPPVMPGLRELGYVVGTVVFGVLAYAALVAASRLGEASVIAPFRYTRLAFALFVAAVVFGERPDLPMLIGAGLIAAAGGYAMWREANLRRRARTPAASLVKRGET